MLGEVTETVGCYGGLSAGIAGFVYTILVILLTAGISLAATVSMNIFPMAMNGESWILEASIIFLGALLAFSIYFITGLIGGIIGIAIKERNAEKQIFRS